MLLSLARLLQIIGDRHLSVPFPRVGRRVARVAPAILLGVLGAGVAWWHAVAAYATAQEREALQAAARLAGEEWSLFLAGPPIRFVQTGQPVSRLTGR